MVYEQKEKVEELKEYTSTFLKKRDDRHEDPQALEADLLWDASRFWATVLYKSRAVSSYKTRAEFEQFVAQYNLTMASSVNLSSLFERYWLREVLGHIHVARAISFATRTFDQLRPWKKELQFMSQFYSDRSKRQQLEVLVADVEEAAIRYEAEKNITLNREGIFLDKWTRIKDVKVEISAMDIYFDPFLHDWDHFEFLYHWKEYEDESDEKGFTIPKAEFQEVMESFNNFIGYLPDIATLESQNIIAGEGDNYRLRFYGIEPSYWTALQSKIGGYHWELILSDTGYATDKERVVTWLKKNPINDGLPDHLAYATKAARIRFLDASLELLLEQGDLSGHSHEFAKLRLDSGEYRDVEVLYKVASGYFDHYKLNNEDAFELYGSLKRLEEKASFSYLYDQAARSWLTLLVITIVRYDDEWSYSSTDEATLTHHLPRVLTLLREGVDKPFFIWKVSVAIRFHRPFILPYLLAEPTTCTFALCILDELEFHSDTNKIFNQYWIKAVELILLSLPPFREHQRFYAKVIFQLFRQLMVGKYSLPYNSLNKRQEIERKRQREEREMSVLNIIENAPIHHGTVYGGPTPLILPELFMLLAEKFASFEEPTLYRNGTIQFPMLKWDALFWLMKTTTNWKVRQYFIGHPEKRKGLVSAFLSQYLESLERNEIEAYDYWEQKEIKQVPLWSEKIERLQLLDWIYPIYFLNESGKLSSFLMPRLDFEMIDERYHKKNRFTAEKLRTHIGVLLQILRKLVLPTLPSGFNKAKLLQIKKQVETKIVEYLNEHSKDLPREGRVDLFSYSKEQEFKQSEKEALLPQIAQAINWFSDKEEVIKAIIATGDIVKLLTVLDYITAEGVKTTLIDRVRTADVLAFLERQTWIPEIHAALIKLSRYPELLPQIEQAVGFWKEKVVKNRDIKEYKERLYISELLVAYFKRDAGAIEAIESPGAYHGSISELNYQAYKTFYHGLLYIKDAPEKAVDIFDDLARRYPKYGSIALNRMIAKLNLGAWKTDSAIYREAYDEWHESASKQLNADELDALEPDLSASLMTILLALGEHQEIENRFYKLELPVRMAEAILTIRVNSLLEQGRTAEALLLVDTAKTYHQFAGHTTISFVRELEETVSGEDNISELLVYYQRIFTNPPAKLIRILPRSFNGKEDIYEFLIKEIVNAADKMLEKIRSIDEIKSEDKFNDLIELVLDARLNGVLGMHVGAQSRGAYSETTEDVQTKQPGRRDLPILDSNKKVWLVCEALIYRGKGNAVPHLQKVFNYHHQRQAFAMLYYDNETIKKGFEGNWKEYTEGILPDTKFPEGMEITTAFEDVTKDYDSKESAIKVGKTIHGTSTIIYHIFVNINYQLRS